MSNLACHVNDYLRLRRALGFKLEWPGHLLPQLLAYHDAAGASTLTADLTIAWAQLPQGVQPLHWAHRLGAARGFAMYLKTIDQATEVPPPPRDVFGAHQRRPPPYLWSDTDVCRLLEAYRRLQPALQAATHETLFGLLSVSGMRLGEVIGLSRDDVDLATGVLTIREAKFGRSRLVPLHPSVTKKLGSSLPAEMSYAPHRSRRGSSSPARAVPSPRIASARYSSDSPPNWSCVQQRQSRACMTSGTALPSTRSSSGTAPAPTARASWRRCPPILDTSTRLARIGISQPRPS